MDDLFDAAIAIAEQRGSIVFLKERSKRPVKANWTTLPLMTPAMIERRYRDGWNIGFRTGRPSEVSPGRYACSFDVDVNSRDRQHIAEMERLLDGFLPGWRRFPKTISGSGRGSFHVWFQTDIALPKRLLFRSKDLVEVNEKLKPAFEIEFYGTGGQVVLPPSIHPDTGLRYKWEAGECPDFANLPFVRRERLEDLFDRNDISKKQKAPEELEPLRNVEVMLFHCASKDNTKGGLHYDDWRNAMFAVHREYAGSDLEDEAYDLLLRWSEQNSRHTQEWFDHVWDTAKDDHERARGLGSLIRETAEERREYTLEQIEFLDERDQEEIEEQRRDPDAYKERKEREREERLNAWESQLDIAQNGSGEILTTEKNLALILEKHPFFKAHLGYCQLQQCVSWRPDETGEWPEALRLLPTSHGDGVELSVPYEPAHYMIVSIFLRENGLGASWKKERINDAVSMVAPRRKFNPLVRIFEEVEWDGQERIKYFFQRCLGAADTELNRAASTAFWESVSLRAIFPGSHCDFVLVIASKQQGVGKTKLLEICASWRGHNFFTSSNFDLADSKKTGEIIAGKIIVELGEGVAVRKHDVSELKAFVTRSVDKYRAAYASGVAKDHPRTCIFVITQNHDQLPPDETGNRRFVLVEVGDPGKGFVGGSDDDCPDFEWPFEKLIENLPQMRAEALLHARKRIARAERMGTVPTVGFPKALLGDLHRSQEEKTPESQVTLWAEKVARFFEEEVPADRLFDSGRVPEHLHGKIVRRLRTTSSEFYCDYLGLRKEEFGRHIRDIAAAFRLYGRCEHKKVKVEKKHTANVWRIIGSTDEFEIIGQEDVTERDRSNFHVRSNVIEMRDERPKRRRRVV